MKFERKYTINQWVKWNRRLSEAIEDFYASFSIHPIILEANLHTHSQIDFLRNSYWFMTPTRNGAMMTMIP